MGIDACEKKWEKARLYRGGHGTVDDSPTKLGQCGRKLWNKSSPPSVPCGTKMARPLYPGLIHSPDVGHLGKNMTSAEFSAAWADPEGADNWRPPAGLDSKLFLERGFEQHSGVPTTQRVYK